jgi:hypothetical protein
VIEELGRKYKHIIQENITLFYGCFGRTDKNWCRIEESVDARNVKS